MVALRPPVAVPRALAAVQPRYLTHLAVVLLVTLSVLGVRSVSGPLAQVTGTGVPPRALPSTPESKPDLLRVPTRLQPETASGKAVAAESSLQTRESKLSPPPKNLALPDRAQPSGQASKPKAPLKYTVAPGDTVSEIADRFGISSETVMWANNLTNPEGLQIGEELVILPVSGVLHTVTSGDNVNDLALVYGVSPESIAEFNSLADPNSLQVGDKLVVPDGKIQMARATGISRGGRSAAPPSASGSFRWPAGGSISQYFGEYGHSGIDIASAQGNPVYAADGGVVVTALKLGYGYGWHLVIDHGNGYKTLYSHLSAFYVDYGERVGKGEQIGAVGSTGLSTGPHLHFEVFQNGVRVNPLKFLP